MIVHFTDLALANSWLLYRKDHAICAGPKTRPIQFLQFRMEVATILLAQHHSADADLSTQSEEEDSNQGVTANDHLPEMIGLKNAMRCRQPECIVWPAKCSCACEPSATVTQPFTRKSSQWFSSCVYVPWFLHVLQLCEGQSIRWPLGLCKQAWSFSAQLSQPLTCSLFYITNAKYQMSYCFFFFSIWCSKHIVAKCKSGYLKCFECFIFCYRHTVSSCNCFAAY